MPFQAQGAGIVFFVRFINGIFVGRGAEKKVESKGLTY